LRMVQRELLLEVCSRERDSATSSMRHHPTMEGRARAQRGLLDRRPNRANGVDGVKLQEDGELAMQEQGCGLMHARRRGELGTKRATLAKGGGEAADACGPGVRPG
jgi:hypothetical protein